MRIIFIFFIFFCGECNTQSLSGEWRGSNEHSILMLNPTSTILEIEIYNDSILTGVIHNYYRKGRFEHIKIAGKINWKDSIFSILEEEEISHNINTRIYETCLGRMRLKLTKRDNGYYLNGKWRDKSNKLFHCPQLKISFEKLFKNDGDLTGIDLPKIRRADIQKVIELTSNETDSIKCAVYDNGELDNDSVSIYFNDSLIIKNQRLSLHPFEFYISFDKTKQIQKLKLIADNLGSIPPNTALLIITTRKNRYTITLSSDYYKNGSVEFFLKL